MPFITALKSPGTLGATLLITGCCIGAGMIGLPVMSVLAGFLPSSLAMLFCYLFTTATGLFVLEATLWFNHPVNLPSIVEHTLGRFGKYITFSLFLFLFYCLFVAYLDGGGTLFADLLSSLLHTPVSHPMGVISCTLFVSTITYAGVKIVDGMNRLLLIGLIISFFVLVSVGYPHVQQNNLQHFDWIAGLGTIPILLICFGYQNLVPSIATYLNRNVTAIRFAIILGNLIPFFVYFLWNYVILGMLTSADLATFKNADMVTELLQGATASLSILFFVKAFSMFAMLTSFLPSTTSFVDFLKDGLQKVLHHEKNNKPLLFSLVFLPPFICTMFYPHLFLKALSFAGGFIDVLLFGVIPALVILVGRHVKKLAGPYQVAGGYLTPVFILILSLCVLFFKLHSA